MISPDHPSLRKDQLVSVRVAAVRLGHLAPVQIPCSYCGEVVAFTRLAGETITGGGFAPCCLDCEPEVTFAIRAMNPAGLLQGELTMPAEEAAELREKVRRYAEGN